MKTRLIVLALACLFGTQALAQDAMTGMFRMTQTTSEILGEQVAGALSDVVSTDTPLDWQVYVPYNYDPAYPPGVFIYLDPNRYGGIPDPWVPVFNQLNMIWVGPRTSDRRQGEELEVWHAILGLRAIEGEYAIDLNRIYIGSNRNTAVTAFRAHLAANEITGAVYIRGSAMWTEISDDHLEQLRRKRYVFITGTNDEAKGQVRQHAEAYRRAGIANVDLIFDTRRIEEVPKPEHIDAAIRYLDAH